MLKLLFKTGTLILIWNKFKLQIFSIIISIIFLWLVFEIYNDSIRIFQIKDTTALLSLFLAKWCITILIIIFNLFLFKSSKKFNINEFEKEDELNNESKEILNKKDILTTTDLVLKKYENKK